MKTEGDGRHLINCFFSRDLACLQLQTILVMIMRGWRRGIGRAVEFRDDRCSDLFELFLVFFQFLCVGSLIRFEPFNLLFDSTVNSLLVIIRQFATQFLFVVQLCFQWVCVSTIKTSSGVSQRSNRSTHDSSSFLASMRSFAFLSSSANFSESMIIRSISSTDNRLVSELMTMLFLLPFPLSSAVTLRIPFTSISKVTSIWGTPRGARGIPMRSNLPKAWLSLDIARSPSKIWMVTAGWFSTAVEKIWLFLVGMTVLRGMIFVITSPTVSIPNVNGLISNTTESQSVCSPESAPAWKAAPYANQRTIT